MLWRLAIITRLLKSDSRVLRDVTQTSVDGAVVLRQANAPGQSDSRKQNHCTPGNACEFSLILHNKRLKKKKQVVYRYWKQIQLARDCDNFDRLKLSNSAHTCANPLKVMRCNSRLCTLRVIPQ